MVLERADCTVLLIDDEEAGLHLRKLVLESAGFRALATTNSDEGMRLFRLHDVDVVVTDHLLGRSTAAGLAAAMKRLKPHVPIVSLSGTTNLDEALRYADHFIGKGEGPDTLIATLEKILAQKPSRPRPIPPAQPSRPATSPQCRHCWRPLWRTRRTPFSVKRWTASSPVGTTLRNSCMATRAKK